MLFSVRTFMAILKWLTIVRPSCLLAPITASLKMRTKYIHCIQSTLSLRTPRYYGQVQNPRLKLKKFDQNKLPLLRTLVITDLRALCSVPTTQFYCFNSRYNGQQAEFFNTIRVLAKKS